MATPAFLMDQFVPKFNYDIRARDNIFELGSITEYIPLTNGQTSNTRVICYHDMVDDSRYFVYQIEGEQCSELPFMRINATNEAYVSRASEDKLYGRFSMRTNQTTIDWSFEDVDKTMMIALRLDRIRHPDWEELEQLELRCAVQYLQSVVANHASELAAGHAL